MVDTERFHLGPHAVQAVGGIATAMGHDRETHALEIATHIPLDIESIARILDSLQEEGIVSTRVDERGLKRIQVEREDYEGFAKLVKNGVHMDDPGLRRNLSALRADPEWAKKARDQHRVLRAITSLGPRTDLEHLVSASGVHAARVRTILGDLETEGYALTDYEEETDTLRVEVPPTTYPKDRFERNLAVISEAEAAQPMLPPFWWVLLGIAGILLVLFIASRFVV